MSSNLTQLRLRLKSNFSAFGNLTLADLQELKWSLRQLIFIEIFRSSHLLNESTEQLMNLGERREKKVAQWKAAGKSVDKEERLEFERDYRTSFMTVVLKGLEQSRWPPSQVPFADPMDDLLHNKETLLDAVNHLLNTLFPSSAPPSAPPKRSTPSKTPVRQQDNDEEQSDSEQEHTPPRPGSTKATPRDNHDSFNNPMETSTASSISKRFGKMDVSHDIEPTTRGRGGDKSIEPNWNTPASVKSSFRESSAYESNHGEAATGDDKKLVEYLLYQNHLLSTQLHHLKQAVTRRSQVEITLSSLLQDVNKCLVDIVEVGVPSTTTTPPPKNVAERATAAAAAAAAATDGVCRECGRSSAMSSSSADTRMSKHDNKMGAAFSWRNIASKLKQLEAQWTEATRAARQVVSTNGSSSYGSSGNRRMSSGIGGSRMGTAGSPSSGMLTSRSTASTMSTSTFGTAASRFTTAGGGSGSSTSEATTGRTMAEKARQWISASAVGTPLAQLQHVDASMATRDALQIECLSLLSALEAWETSVAEETELTMSTATNPQQQQHQLRRLWLQRCEQHSTIQSIVQRLLALMVVQPGSTADDIESTAGVRATDSMIQDASGRDVQHSAVGRLIHQVEEDVFPRVKKSSALLQSWTSLCDSAVMEHVLHVRALSRQRREQQRWQRFLRQLVEKLSSFGRSTKKAMEESVQKISTLSKILQEMMRHVAQAEDSRVAGFGLSTTGAASSSSKGKGGTMSARSASSGSDNTAVGVSPMDSLCRGIAGPEVASLMQVLRQHHHTFRDLDDELQELVQRFVKTLLWEQAGMQSFIRASLGHEIPSTAAVEEMKPPPVRATAAPTPTPTSRSGRVRRL